MACDYNIELTIKELQGGLHLGRMQVTRDADRVARSVALSVCAYLLLVRLYGREEASGQPWSLCRLKQRFHADLMREQVDRTERKWQRKLKQYADAAWFLENHPSLLSMKQHRIAPELKEQIINRIKNDGVSVVQAAKDHGVHENTIYAWIANKVEGQPSLSEFLRLKKENRQLLELVGEMTLKLAQ